MFSVSRSFVVLKMTNDMQSLLKKITGLNTMVLQGKSMEAFEMYYHDDVVMQENELEPTIGKPANHAREEAFFAAVTEFRKAEPLHVTAGENVTAVVWQYDYTHKQWGVRNYTQVSVQQWKDGRIIHEQFFYAN
jgi:hypothetical protein